MRTENRFLVLDADGVFLSERPYWNAALGAALGGLLTDAIGYHRGMLLAAGLQLLGALVALIFLPNVQRTGMVAGHVNAELSPVTGRRETAVVQVVLDVEIIIVHPVGVVEIKRYPHQAPPREPIATVRRDRIGRGS
mgnify:CR=1 FL=1